MFIQSRFWFIPPWKNIRGRAILLRLISGCWASKADTYYVRIEKSSVLPASYFRKKKNKKNFCNSEAHVTTAFDKMPGQNRNPAPFGLNASITVSCYLTAPTWRPTRKAMKSQFLASYAKLSSHPDLCPRLQLLPTIAENHSDSPAHSAIKFQTIYSSRPSRSCWVDPTLLSWAFPGQKGSN